LTDAYDLLAEARWEQEGIRRAAQRYREAAAAADPSALPSGQKLLREVVPALRDRIKELQVEGQMTMVGRHGQSRWAAPIQLLEADILAIITVISALHSVGETGSTTVVAHSIAAAVRAEIDYRQWIEEQSVANKAAREAQDWEHVDLVAAFKRRHPEADKRAWKSFSKKIGHAKAARWDEETSVQLGNALIRALVDAAPDRFEVELATLVGGRSQKCLRLSPETMELMNDIETRAAVARPMLMPMIIPPIPWRYER